LDSRGKVVGENHSHPVVPEFMTACQPQADALALHWEQFIQAEPELAKKLIGEVPHAIDSRTLRQYEGGGD
jgi:hypothetical protein